MTLSLKPYPEYKESGLPWLAKIPVHWEVFRNGRLFEQRNQTGFSSLPILEVSLRTGVRVRDFENSNRKQVMSDREEYKRACQGDIAYNMMRMWQGAVGVAPVDGLISPAYVVARPFPGTESRFFAYLFRTNVYKDEVDKYSRGIVKDRNRLYWEDFKQMPSLFPPTDEQKLIADFLEAYGRMVARLTRAKRRLIELLNEQKQVIIHRAVTRGLSTDTRLKPSGIEWLGDVPEHWRFIPLKYLCRHVQNGATPPTTERSYYDDGSVPWFGPSSLGTDVEIGEPVRLLSLKAFADGKARKISSPAIMVVVIGATCGRIALLKSDGSCNQQITAFELRPGAVEPLFVAYQLKLAENVLRSKASTATIPIIDGGKLARCPTVVPPIDEQRQIMARLVPQLIPFQTNIVRIYQEIEFLREYRTRLISDVVTGRLDVRSVELPALDAAESSEEIDSDDETEADELADSEEPTDD